MLNEKCCRNCIHFPCIKNDCDINNKQHCSKFKSITQSAIEIIDKCNKEVEDVN